MDKLGRVTRKDEFERGVEYEWVKGRYRVGGFRFLGFGLWGGDVKMSFPGDDSAVWFLGRVWSGRFRKLSGAVRKVERKEKG